MAGAVGRCEDEIGMFGIAVKRGRPNLAPISYKITISPAHIPGISRQDSVIPIAFPQAGPTHSARGAGKVLGRGEVIGRRAGVPRPPH
jgi:hypothetical protein